jgi:hypothetical protein
VTEVWVQSPAKVGKDQLSVCVSATVYVSYLSNFRSTSVVRFLFSQAPPPLT